MSVLFTVSNAQQTMFSFNFLLQRISHRYKINKIVFY